MFHLDAKILFILSYYVIILSYFVDGTGDTTSHAECDKNHEKVEKLKLALETFTECVDTEIDLSEPLVPMNCNKFQTLFSCLESYLTAIQDCYEDVATNWNKTIQAIKMIDAQLCTEEANLIDKFYREDGIICLKRVEVTQCGSSLSNILLNPNKNFSRELLDAQYKDCKNISNVTECIVSKLKDRSICKSPNAADFVEKFDAIIANMTGCGSDNAGVKEFPVSSTFIWILAISVTGLVTLTPS